jgi:hypothetical protein
VGQNQGAEVKYLDDLLYWINERDRMRIRKQEGVLPFSTDPIMAETRWCNVRREDDKVTMWIHQNWLNRNTYPDVMSFAMCVARMVNWPDTLDELGFPYEWDPNHFIDVIAARKGREEKVWTSAYMITGGFSAGGESKEVIIARVLDGAHKNLFSKTGRITTDDTLESAWHKVQTPGIGTFLAAQVIADLKHAHPLRHAKDWNYWCAVGPGSTKGLNFLHDRPQEHAIPQDRFVKEVAEVRELLRHSGWALDAQNVQNCLCEFHKFIKIKYHGGRAKSRYRPNQIGKPLAYTPKVG